MRSIEETPLQILNTTDLQVLNTTDWSALEPQKPKRAF